MRVLSFDDLEIRLNLTAADDVRFSANDQHVERAGLQRKGFPA